MPILSILAHNLHTPTATIRSMSDASIIHLQAGANVGGYTLLSRLGAGSMGSVWRVRDEGGQIYAMKILRDSFAENLPSDNPTATQAERDRLTARERLRREALALKKVHHPGVCGIVDMELDDSLAFIVTELIEGRNLREDVEVNGPYVGQDLAHLARKLMQAVQAVHNAGLIHRDIKPTNVMVSASGPILVDFGIAMSEGESHVTRTGLVMGTPGFIAPEIIDGAESDEVTDWWSVTSVLGFAATGKPIFGSSPMMAVLERAASGNANLAGLPARTMQAFRNALLPDRSQRATPDQLLAAIEQDAFEQSSLGGQDLPFEYADGTTGPPSNPRKLWQPVLEDEQDATRALQDAARTFAIVAGTAPTIVNSAEPATEVLSAASAPIVPAVTMPISAEPISTGAATTPPVHDGQTTAMASANGTSATQAIDDNLSPDQALAQLVAAKTAVFPAVEPREADTETVGGTRVMPTNATEPQEMPETPRTAESWGAGAEQEAAQYTRPMSIPPQYSGQQDFENEQPLPMQNDWQEPLVQQPVQQPVAQPALQSPEMYGQIPASAIALGRREVLRSQGTWPCVFLALPLGLLASSMPLVACGLMWVVTFVLATVGIVADSKIRHWVRKGTPNHYAWRGVVSLPWHLARAIIQATIRTAVVTLFMFIAAALMGRLLPAQVSFYDFEPYMQWNVLLPTGEPISRAGAILAILMAGSWLVAAQSDVIKIGAALCSGVPFAQYGQAETDAGNMLAPHPPQPSFGSRNRSRLITAVALWTVSIAATVLLAVITTEISWFPLFM